AELVDLVPVGGELVAGADLPRQSNERALDLLIVDTLLAACRRFQAGRKTARRSVAHERAGNGRVDGPLARGGEEPQLVMRDWSPLREVEVINSIEGAGVRKTPVFQVLREVVGLPLAVAPRGKERATEFVAAFLRNHVQAHATRGRVGADAAG